MDYVVEFSYPKALGNLQKRNRCTRIWSEKGTKRRIEKKEHLSILILEKRTAARPQIRQFLKKEQVRKGETR